jgi:DNA segregation ATPase FtsK/SpoIIIE, S-DNA-T family
MRFPRLATLPDVVVTKMLGKLIGEVIKWTLIAAFSVAGVVLVYLAKCVVQSVLWLAAQACKHPRTTLGVAVAAAALYLLGWQWVAGILVAGILAASIWRAAHPTSFEPILGRFTRTWWRRWWVYRRRWSKISARSGLTVETRKGKGRKAATETATPKLVKVTTTPYWDTLRVRLEVGQELADYQGAAERIRHAYKGLRITIGETDPENVGIEIMRKDPFRYLVIPAAPMPATTAEIDYTRLIIGTTEHCQPWPVSVVGGHLAIAGGTNSGKAGIPWNIMRQLAPAIADRTVRLHFVDPKRMELVQAREIAESYETDHGTPGKGDGVLGLLDRLVADMQDAQDRAATMGERDFEPSQDVPLDLLIIDELAPVLVYWPRSIRDKIEALLGLILTQGRATGHIVIGEIQEPTKDKFKIRDLFARRIGLRVPTEAHTEAILADDAVDRGGLCHRIPESLPGVAFQMLDEEARATRTRSGHVTNEDIAELVGYVKALREVTTLDSRRPTLVSAQATGEPVGVA